MTVQARDAVLKDLHVLFDQGVFANLTDGQLLERFVDRSGAEAERVFAILVERHGPMVLRVCRQVLNDPHDAEDAFQATFTVLIRKARSIRKRSSCGSWLHGVARRAAAAIRTASARRREHERKSARTETDLAAELPDDCPGDLPGLIDEELGRLREEHRSPLVLCYLEGHTCEEAAHRLGWPVGTVKSRLARGRERLRRRLIRRGVAPGLVLAAGTDLPAPAGILVPAALEARVLEESVRFAARGAASAALPAAIEAAVRSELRLGAVSRAARAAIVLGGLGVALTLAASRMSRKEDAPPPEANDAPALQAARPEPPKASPSPIHVRVVDGQGKAVAGAEVLVFQADQPDVRLTTDPLGRVVLPPLRFNRPFTLMARGRGAVAGLSHPPLHPVKRGSAQEPLVLGLMPLTHEVAGSLVDPQGRPISGVRVMGRGLNFEESNFYPRRRVLEEVGGPLGSAVSDAQGRFTLTLPARANVTLAFRHPRWVSPRISVAEDERTIAPITLQPAGRITGSIRDAATGVPVAGAHVGTQFLEPSSLSSGEYAEAVSDAEGKFALDSLDEGVYNVHLSRVPGHPRATARVVAAIRVRSGEDATAELRVFDGSPLTGMVIDPTTTRPLPHVLVCGEGPAHLLPGSSIHSSYTNERGEFTLFLHPGENFVSLLGPESAMRSSRLGRTTVIVPARGETPPIRLVGPVPERPAVVRRGGAGIIMKTRIGGVRRLLSSSSSRRRVPGGRTITGKVLDAEGHPLAGVSIAAWVYTETSSRTVSTVVSDREGTFLAKGLPRDEFTLIATRPERDRRNDSLKHLVPAGRDTVDFTFGPEPAAATPSGDPIPAADEPIPPSLKERLTFVALGNQSNEFLADGPGGHGDDLYRLRQGVRDFQGDFYRIGERLIHVWGQPASGLPARVSGIAVGARAHRIRILHTARGNVGPGSEVGVYNVHYANRTSERIPVVYGRELANWTSSTGDPLVAPTGARVAWTGSNDMTDRIPGREMKVHLFAFTWKNPHPERLIATIDVRVTNPEAELVLVASTLERDERL